MAESVGDLLRSWRQSRGLSQMDLAMQAGFSARVSFPTAAGSPLVLMEDTTDSNPVVHDLNLNGALGEPDVTSDYRVLPVTITISWRGIRAINRTLTYRYLFLRRT